MDYAWLAALILGGVLAISGLIVAKKPDAKELIAKLQPFQAIIGVVLLVFGVIHIMDAIHMLAFISLAPLFVLPMILGVFGGILLGILFGVPLIARVSASGAAKAEEMGKKMAPFQTIIGLVCLISGFLMLLTILGVLKPH